MIRAKLARRLLALLLALAFGFAHAPAAAQSPSDLKRARGQFQRGIELEQAGNFTEAIQQFREVGQIRMTPQVRFHIAFCEDGLGRLVTALGGYDLALSQADQVGPDFRNEVETAMAKLRERIPKLLIERGSGADAALVQLDGIDVGASSIGVETPLDPGPHKVTAAAPGYTSFNATVELKEREVTRVTLELEPEPEPTEPTGPVRTEVKVVERRSDTPNRTVPYIIGGAGIASVIAGGAFFALQQSTLADLEDNCPDPTACPRSNQDTYERAEFYGYAAPIAAGVGVAAIGTAVVLIVFEKKKQPAPASASVTLQAAAPGAWVGASLAAKF